jgi:hypothetical protein
LVANFRFTFDIGLDLLFRSLATVVEPLLARELDQYGATDIDSWRSEESIDAAGTGMLRWRFFTDGNDSIRCQRAICSALAGAMLVVAINNGSTIALDNQLIVDSFIVYLVSDGRG